MNLEQIKAALADGKIVHWKNQGYRVIKDNVGQYLIGWDIDGPRAHFIGLTHTDGVTMNGAPEDFYIERIPVDRQVLLKLIQAAPDPTGFPDHYREAWCAARAELRRTCPNHRNIGGSCPDCHADMA